MADVFDLRAKLKLEYDKSEAKKIGQDISNAINQSTTINSTKAKKIGNFVDIKKIKSQLSELKSKFQDVVKPLKILMNRIGRIALYRIIRGMLKTISDGFREGIQNIYQFSKNISGSFATSMDTAATSLLYLKNSLGAALAPVLESLIPILVKVIDKFVELINVVNQLFATLSGKSTYMKAIKYQTEYAESAKDAAGAVKELLFGFDELNVLNSTSSGSGSTLDYDKMFKETPLGTAFTAFQMNVSDIIFNWKDLTAEDIMAKVITGLNGVTGALIGWKFGGIKGAVLGAVIGTGIGLLTSSLTFNADGKIDKDELKSMLYGVIGAIVGGALGIATGTGVVKGALLGFSATMGLQGLIKSLVFGDNCKYSDFQLFSLLAPALGAILGAKIGMHFGIGGALIGLTIGATIGFAIKSVAFNTEGAKFDDMPEAYDTGVFDVSPSQYEDNSVLKKLKLKAKQADRLAGGGIPDVGSLFWAGENGAELIAQVGGHSTVYNEEQLGESLAYANESVVNAINTLIGVVRNKSSNVTISASDIRKAVNTSSMRVGV